MLTTNVTPTLDSHEALLEVVSAFVCGPFTQREFRSLNAPWMLDLILSLPPQDRDEAIQQLRSLEPYHHKIIRNDCLSELLPENGTQAWEMLSNGRKTDPQELTPQREVMDLYMDVMAPFIVKTFEAIQGKKSEISSKQERKQLPQGIFNGVQGFLNLSILVRYVLEEKLHLSKEDIAQGIVDNKFTQMFFQEHGLGGALMTTYSNSPSRMVLDVLKNHPDLEYQKYFSELRLRHFAQVDNLWTSESKEKLEDGWAKSKNSTIWKNVGEARKASQEVLHACMGFPYAFTGSSETYIKAFENLIKTITQNQFDETQGMYGRRYMGMRHFVYDGSLPFLIIDFLKHHKDPNVQRHFASLKPHHFPKINKNGVVDPITLTQYSRYAFGELTNILIRPKGLFHWKLSEIPEKITLSIMEATPLAFGGNVMAYVADANNYTEQWIDFLSNHPVDSVREKFTGIQPYHFSHAPHKTWTVNKDASLEAPEKGWELCKEDNRWKNKELARDAMNEFISRLLDSQHSEEWNLEKIPKELLLKHFDEIPIRFNAKLRRMIAAVYFDSAREALHDYFQSRQFAELIENSSWLKHEITNKWGTIGQYILYATSTLEQRFGHRTIQGQQNHPVEGTH